VGSGGREKLIGPNEENEEPAPAREKTSLSEPSS
jgi:hypothetical protein